jgi:hypothetical protein
VNDLHRQSPSRKSVLFLGSTTHAQLDCLVAKGVLRQHTLRFCLLASMATHPSVKQNTHTCSSDRRHNCRIAHTQRNLDDVVVAVRSFKVWNSVSAKVLALSRGSALQRSGYFQSSHTAAFRRASVHFLPTRRHRNTTKALTTYSLHAHCGTRARAQPVT